MKTISGLAIWFAQLVFLILAALLQSILHFAKSVFAGTKAHAEVNSNRGKTFVRAYFFLESLDLGDTPEEANKIVRTLFSSVSDPDSDGRIIRRAAAYAKQHHGGNQLPVIAEAKSKGFSDLSNPN